MDAAENRFLKNFSPAMRDYLLVNLEKKTYEPGGYLFHEGNVADGIYLILRGQVEIVRKAESILITLGAIEEGDFFGEVAVFDGQGRSSSARANGPVEIARIPREIVMKALESEPAALTLDLLGNVLTHLRHTNDLFVREVVRKEKLYLVGEMASSLMHDFRNPIAGVRLAAELIQARHPDEKTTHWCQVIQQQSDRMVAMARELLEFSRGESSLKIVRTDTDSFLAQVEELLGDFVRHSGAMLEMESIYAEVEMDVMRMIRLVQNLFTNAVEAMAQSPVKRLTLKIGVQNQQLQLEVKDTGPGVPEAIRLTLFEPFVSYGKSNGVGLGMAIVRNIVTAHGGTIFFESSSGKGAFFYISIPQPIPNQSSQNEKSS